MGQSAFKENPSFYEKSLFYDNFKLQWFLWYRIFQHLLTTYLPPCSGLTLWQSSAVWHASLDIIIIASFSFEECAH